jgi:hypothetical protein
MSARKLQSLTDGQKEILRQVVRRQEQQPHFLHFKWGAGTRDVPETALEANLRARLQSQLLARVSQWADPIPEPYEFVQGIEHYNANPDNRNRTKWLVVRAVTSRKMHYYTMLKSDVEGVFHMEHPDLSPASGGSKKLEVESWRRLKKTFHLEDFNDYLKHILPKHDGEARLLGDCF